MVTLSTPKETPPQKYPSQSPVYLTSLASEAVNPMPAEDEVLGSKFGLATGSLTTYLDSHPSYLADPITNQNEGVDEKDLYAVNVGTATSDGTGNLTVYLNDAGTRSQIDGILIAPVPEPSGIALFAGGLAMLALMRRRS